MVQGNLSSPVGTGVKQGLVPQFGLSTGVGEYQAAGTGVELPGNLREHLQPHVPGPGKAFDGLGQECVDDQALVLTAFNQLAALWHQYLKRMRQIAQGGRQPPDHQLRMPATQACQGQLQLYAAFVSEQFVPFIHHDHAQAGAIIAGFRSRQ
ncbi:hypothetical protein D3C73_974200 [compost metagenome]